jgi:hypothetical protein
MSERAQLREEAVDKPLCHRCYHYFDDSQQYPYVGAVWQDDEGGSWEAFCTMSVLKWQYGHLGEFDSKDAALTSLEGRIRGERGKTR